MPKHTGDAHQAQAPPNRDYFLKPTNPTPAGGQRVDRVWTCEEWTALCRHLHNDNGPTDFVLGFRDHESGAKWYYKSKTHPSAKAISWAWSSIQGRCKQKVAYAPYSYNAARRESRWGLQDFDAHDGNKERAHRHAVNACELLLRHRSLSVILESSGNGWHVWAISEDFRPISYWVQLLKAVAVAIDAPIEPGICEIFPPDSVPTNYGKGVRAPGCWNPGTDTLSEIHFQNCTSLLAVLTKSTFLGSSTGAHFPERSKQVSLSSPSRQGAGRLYPLWVSKWSDKFAIKAAGTRNDQLGSLVGTIFYQVGHDMGKKLAAAQFAEKTAKTKTTEAKHLEAFWKHWQGLEKKWLTDLTESEKAAYAKLSTPNERDAFRIIRSFNRKAVMGARPDFPVACDNLAARLGITRKGAAWVRDSLATKKIISRTKDFKANVAPAYYRWLPEFVMDSDSSNSDL